MLPTVVLATVLCAPVPKPKPPPVECAIVVVDPKANPVGWKYAELRIRNNTGRRIVVTGESLYGLGAFVDVDVRSRGVRVSEEFYEMGIVSPTGVDREIATLEPGKWVAAPLHFFRPIPEKLQKPGEYVCRARFAYQGYSAESAPVEVTVTAKNFADERAEWEEAFRRAHEGGDR